MKHEFGTDEEKRFARAWSSWLERPVQRAPGVAAARVAGLLRQPAPRRRPAWVLGTAGASLALVVLLVVALPPRTGTELPGPLAVTPPAVEPAQPGEVLIWLDDETPLYMHFQPPAVPAGNKS